MTSGLGDEVADAPTSDQVSGEVSRCHWNSTVVVPAGPSGLSCRSTFVAARVAEVTPDGSVMARLGEICWKNVPDTFNMAPLAVALPGAEGAAI